METQIPQQAEIPALCMALDGALAAIGQGEVPEWIPLLPKGPRIQGRTGREWQLADVQKVIAASFRNLPKIPVDWNHATEKYGATSPHTQKAAGWIVAMEARPDGVWGKVEWTNGGARSVAEKEYRYISPVFIHTPQGEVLYLKSAALTNNPELKMKALNAMPTGGLMPGEATKPPQQARDAKAGQDTQEPTTKAEARPSNPAGQGEPKAVASAADVAQPPSNNLAPHDEHEKLKAQCAALQGEVQAMKQAQHSEKVEQALSQALQGKKIAPASMEYHRACCSTAQGLAAFKAFCEGAPALLQDHLVSAGAPSTEEGANGLTPHQQAMCSTLGIDPRVMATTAKKLKARGEIN